jgi:hypothetical protein
VNQLLFDGSKFPYLEYTYIGQGRWGQPGQQQTGSYAPANADQRFILKRDVFLDALAHKNYPLLSSFFFLNKDLFPQIATTQDTVRGFFGPPQTIIRNTTFFEYLALDYDSLDSEDRYLSLVELLLFGLNYININSLVRGDTVLCYFLLRTSYNEKIAKAILKDPLLYVNQRSERNNYTALYCAVQVSNEEIVNTLLEKGATDVKVQDYRDNSTVLLEAITKVAYTEQSLPTRRNNLPINEELKKEYTTAYTKARRILENLIAHGFDVNFTNDYGATPLMKAVEEGSLRLVQYLLSIPGINVNAKDSHGRTAAYFLHRAVEVGGLLSVNNKEAIQAILRLLVKAGLNLESQDYDDQTALDYFQEKADEQGGYFDALVDAVQNFKVNEPTGLNIGPLPFGPNEANFQGGRKRKQKTHKRKGKGKAKKTRKL